MSNPISDLRDFLSESPSVVFPQDVLEYLPAIEAENAKLRAREKSLSLRLILREDENDKLRELTQQMFALIANHEETGYMDGELGRQIVNAVYERMKELGIEADE